VYYVIVPIYPLAFFIFNSMMNRQGMIEFSEVVLMTIPVILAIGFTIFVELLHVKSNKKV